MRAKNVPADYLRKLAEGLGMRVNIGTQKGSFVNFTLKPDISDVYRSYSPNPTEIDWSIFPDVPGWKWRKSNAICYHGHYHFLELLFEDYPDAVVESSRYGAVKYTSENFEEEAEQYGENRLGNPGNIYYPIKRRECCGCENSDIN